MFVAQLVERLLPTPEVRDLNPVPSKISIERLQSTGIEKMKIKKKRPEMGHLKNVLRHDGRMMGFKLLICFDK